MTPPLKTTLWQDFKRGVAASAFGCVSWALVELIATAVAASGPLDVATLARFALLDLTLVALAGVVLAPLLGAAAVGARLLYALADAKRARVWPGLLARGAGSSALAAWTWALLLAAIGYTATSAWLTFRFTTHFAAPDVVAVVLAWVQLFLIAIWAGVALALARAVRRLGRWSRRSLGRFDPLSRIAPALLAATVLAALAVGVVLTILPHAKPLLPIRHLLAGAAFVAGAYGHMQLVAWRGRILPAQQRPRRIAVAALAAGFALVIPLTLLKVGADPHAKFLAVSSSPPLRTIIDAVRAANDFDGDGYGSLLGENDCAPFDRAIHPGARDIPDNGVDENCNGRDFALSALPSYKRGERMPVPEAYRRDWNFLLITIDTLRYDHTGFGGYIEKRNRNLTPNLDALVAKAISFTFCNAPSAGTMASIPAIQASKFFHSGIALGEERSGGKPPKVRPENTLLAEIMKRTGYRTGAIVSHEYFNDWGLDQGFDTYDNEIGKVRDPSRITSHELTDKTLEWISRNTRKKWFLWVHYVDPHGFYMAHPEFNFGTSEEDKYDSEIAYTDKHLGRLFDELSRMPGADRTIIIITSDHGDGFKEHGHINHGFYLHKEVLHIPLIVYIPDGEPRTVDGAVSPLDIVPTMADLAGIDVSDLSFEGESLVPQLFYGRDAHDRVVFAETNAGGVQRTAITSKYKLIAKLKSNVYQLYDLTKDEWEQKNVWKKDAKGSELMKGYLDDWLERVFYSRDTLTNQAASKRKWHIVTGKPQPQFRLEQPALFDDGALELFGYDLTAPKMEAGKKLAVKPYFRVHRQPSGDFKLQAEAWVDVEPGGRKPPRSSARSGAEVTAEGMFPTSQWREGDIIRDSLRVSIPPAWTGDSFFVGVRLLHAGDRAGTLAVQGATKDGDDKLAVLGTVGLLPPAQPIKPTQPMPAKPAQPMPAKPAQAVPAKPAKPGLGQGTMLRRGTPAAPR